MAKKIILSRMNSNLPKGKMVIAGTFSQKKKLWEAICEIDSEGESKSLYDDVEEKTIDASYSGLCKLLTKSGRAHILEKDSETPSFFMVECEENEIRDSDFDDDGNLVYNPAVKKDEG